MKINHIIMAVLCMFLFCHSVEAQGGKERAQVTDLQWQESEQRLTYTLSKKAVVKIRAGTFSGPVYRTLLNLKAMPKGKNEERWDGKDETGGVDFLAYGKVHFCVDVPVNPVPDAKLEMQVTGGTAAPYSATIDLEKKIKQQFLKQPAELRVYVDNKLNLIERITTLPFTFTLKKGEVKSGKHLVVVNLWQGLDFSAVAYNAFEVLIPQEDKGKASGIPGRIVFTELDGDGFWQVFLSDLGGSRQEQLTTSPVDKRYPAWSLDGKQIVFVDNAGGLWIRDMVSKQERKIPLALTCSEPKFSPDAKKLIFTGLEDVYHGNTKVWEVDLASLQLKKVVNRPWLQYNPNYAPDASQIVFTDGPELFGQNILKLDLKTNDITQLTDNGPYDYDMQPAFFKSAQEIVYATNENGDYEIYSMDKFGRNKKNLSLSPQSSDMFPQVAADDSRIFFLSDRGGGFQVWQMNDDGSKQQQLTHSKSGVNSFSVYTE